MENNDTISISGKFILKKFDADGNLVETREVKNVITNDGKNEVAGLICADQASSYTAFDYIGIGTGTTSASATDTALENETDRQAATGTLTTTSVTDDTMQLVASFTGINATITEAGVFNASTGGTMLARQTFSGIPLTTNDTLEVTYKVQVS